MPDMTMLEKMARDAYLIQIGSVPGARTGAELWHLASTRDRDRAFLVARAALLAIREPDVAMTRAGGLAECVVTAADDPLDVQNFLTAPVFTAMVDAILSPTTAPANPAENPDD